jgi:hypothetical protein
MQFDVSGFWKCRFVGEFYDNGFFGNYENPSQREKEGPPSPCAGWKYLSTYASKLYRLYGPEYALQTALNNPPSTTMLWPVT